jgi:hypothetical protein
MSDGRRWLLGGAVVLAVVATAMGASAVPPRIDAMPDVLWVAGLADGAGNDALRFRVGGPRGEELAEPRVDSTWGKAHEAPTGVSVRRALHGWAKTRANLASHGVLPYAEIASAGYESTGRAEDVDGTSWRELRKFDEHFSSWSVGWWLALPFAK